MKSTRFLGAAALALTLTLGAIFQASAAPQGGGRAARGLRAALSTLDLSQDQKDQIRAKLETQKDAFRAMREQMKADHEALQAAASAAKPDPATVGKAFLKVHQNREALKAEMKKTKDSLSTVLTPAQQAKLDGYLAAMRHGRQARMGGRGRE